MEFTTFVRKPFTVEAVQITHDNIRDIAPLVGIIQVEDGRVWIRVDRKKVPVLSEVEVGYWMTKVDGKIRCYSDNVFREQFTPITPEIQQWMDYLNQQTTRAEEATLNSG
jgi:hypothetical protein